MKMAKVLIPLLFLIINLINFNSADFDKSKSYDSITSYHIQQLGSSSLVNLRDTRKTGSNSDLSTQYISSSELGSGLSYAEPEQHSSTLKQIENHHDYYNSTIFVDKTMVENYWVLFQNISSNNMLSHRRAMTVQLSFDFPFYGNPVRNITVATGGFLYTGEYVHSWLAATQYIAPLMADFDSSLSNNSLVRYKDNGTAFTVVWENVFLKDKRKLGTYTFSTTLHKNGDIVFVYFNVPMPIGAIQDDKHPVKVGLSDAYIIDKVILFARRKTIYEYHRVNFASTDIQSNTIIYLKALPTCLGFNTCQSCLDHNTNFDCAWCPTLMKCSIGMERKRQEWLLQGCDRKHIKNIEICPPIQTKGNNNSLVRNDSSEHIDGSHKKNIIITAKNDDRTTSNDIPELDYSSLLKLREKRETGGTSDLSPQYTSISKLEPGASPQLSPVLPSPTETPALEHSPLPPLINLTSTVTDKPLSAKSIKLDDKQHQQNDKPLLGVTDIGQHKEYLTTTRPPIVSDPININPTKKGTIIKKVQPVLKEISPVLISDPLETSDDFVRNIDISEDEVAKTLKDNNYTLNYTEEHHVYYNSTIFMDKPMVENYWDAFKNISSNNMLSTSHRRAMTVQLSFDFPFYGNPVRNITVATGGFLYTGEYVHSWLAATQYIAPLMANFDSSLSNDSLVRYNDNGTAFTVVWENVFLQDKREVGTYTFSTTLHKNGDIVFVYFNVPMPIEAIQDDKHPVKVGLSDAYIIDKVIFFARRKTIYEYHRVNFAGTDIQSNTIIYLKALPTCLGFNTCQSCLDHNTSFDCAWCPTLNKCSIGTDRKRQEWLQKGCDRTQIKNIEICPAIGTKGNDSGAMQNESRQHTDGSHHDNQSIEGNPIDRSGRKDTSAEVAIDGKSSDSNKMAILSENDAPKSGVGLAIGLMIPICIIMSILAWVFYAYRNPHTRSGQLLIQYRPTHWSWRRGEARYTAATIHM